MPTQTIGAGQAWAGATSEEEAHEGTGAEFGVSTFESFKARSFLEMSRSCGCELVADESDTRLRRLFGLESKDRRRSGSVTAFDGLTPATPWHNRSAADLVIEGWPALEIAERIETSDEGFGNIQGTENCQRAELLMALCDSLEIAFGLRCQSRISVLPW